jgi:hypothetical protein
MVRRESLRRVKFPLKQRQNLFFEKNAKAGSGAFLLKGSMNKTTTIRPFWTIKHAIHGASTIEPRSIRYLRNERHPYGWQVGFEATLILPTGDRKRAYFSALGTSRNAAMSNALHR